MQTLLAVFVLLVAVWAAYAQVTAFDFIPLDDPGYVYENQMVQHGLSLEGVRWAFTSLEHANWHPLTWLSLMADYQLYGLHPGGYHLTNLLLHQACTLLLFAWLLLATARLWPSAAVALLFGIHPAHVESVAWVTERKDVLSTFFFFLVLLAYTRYAQTKAARFYLGALAALGLGLLAKPMLVTVPPLLLLLDVWPLRRVRQPRDWLHLAYEKLPFVLLALASCTITFLAQHQGGATVPLAALPLSVRVAGALAGYTMYLENLCWPVNLGVFYPYRSDLSPGYALVCALGLAVVTGIAVAQFRTRPYLLIGWLWFLGTLVPVIGLVQVGIQAVADRYTYQPYVGLFIALCWAGANLYQSRPGLRPVLVVGWTAAVGACLVLCCRQVGYWRDGVTLFERTLAVTQPNTITCTLLGDSYAEAHRYEEARSVYQQVFRDDVNNTELLTKFGHLELMQGHWVQAGHWLQQATARSDCHEPLLFNNLGFALQSQGRLDEAQAAYQRSIALRPGYAYAHNNLADILLARGQTAAAIPELEAAIALNPDLLTAATKLAWQYSFVLRDHNPERSARALRLAQHAVDLSGGISLGSLDSLAAAHAALDDWTEASVAARAALLVASHQPGNSPDQIVLRGERAAAYQAGHWPAR